MPSSATSVHALCAWPWQVLLQLEPAGSEVEELALKAGGRGISFVDYILPGFRNWNLSNQGREWCLEDVGKIFLIGTEGLQRISRELASNRVTMIKYGAMCDQVAALPGKCLMKAGVSQAKEHEPGHNWGKGNARYLQSCGTGKLGASGHGRTRKGAEKFRSRAFGGHVAV